MPASPPPITTTGSGITALPEAAGSWQERTAGSARLPTLAARLFGRSRIALVIRLLRRRSQTMERVCSFLLSTAVPDFPTLAAVR